MPEQLFSVERGASCCEARPLQVGIVLIGLVRTRSSWRPTMFHMEARRRRHQLCPQRTAGTRDWRLLVKCHGGNRGRCRPLQRIVECRLSWPWKFVSQRGLPRHLVSFDHLTALHELDNKKYCKTVFFRVKSIGKRADTGLTPNLRHGNRYLNRR